MSIFTNMFIVETDEENAGAAFKALALVPGVRKVWRAGFALTPEMAADQTPPVSDEFRTHEAKPVGSYTVYEPAPLRSTESSG